ncbi:hypothetical protein RYX36_029884 [Vicia faba]
MAYPNEPQPSSCAPMPLFPAAIFGSQFCIPYPLELVIMRKVMTVSEGNFSVSDPNGNILLKVKDSHLTHRRVLVDVAGNPIATLRRKRVTMHDRWVVFRGESTKANDLIFTLKRSSRNQFKTKLNVYLAGNTKESVCDFQVNGSWLQRSCAIYAGESNNIVAQVIYYI